MTDDTSTGRRGLPSEHDTGTAEQNELADLFGTLARSLQRQPDLQAILDTVVRAAVDTVPGAQAAAISEIQRRREVKTLAATGELARAMDHAQHDLGEGPCLDTLYEHRTVRLPDLAAERRWPRFAGRARELGVGSVLAVQLFVDGTDLGALNLVSRHAHAFGDESEHVALLFASHASVALSGERTIGNLRAAVSTREVIGQAQGILMERFKVTGEMAFQMLMVASQHSNRKLRDIAADLVTTGEISQA
ncbi:MAG: GAF and ANTAR domain-containing protein [Actinobacteria bacterium]|nr:GAF and ANTAR domain-containing protein [Actinomycetota bacterium]